MKLLVDTNPEEKSGKLCNPGLWAGIPLFSMLLIGGLMILYAGYLYGSTVFSGSNPTKAKSAIRNAIIGVLVVVFSFAIWKGLVSSFL